MTQIVNESSLDYGTFPYSKVSANCQVRVSMCKTVQTESENFFWRNAITQRGVLPQKKRVQNIEKCIKGIPIHSLLAFEVVGRNCSIPEVTVRCIS